MGPRGRRSARSYVVEIALRAVFVAAIYIWLTVGPQWFGEWFAEYLTSR